MDEINKIRKEYFSQGKSINAIAKKYNRSWNTVKTYITMSREEIEERVKRPARMKLVATEEVLQAIRDMLTQERLLNVKKKQRYTAQVIYEELTSKGIYHGSPRTMRNILTPLRKEMEQNSHQGYLPLEFNEGSTIQVDHGEADVVVDGQRQTTYLFVASLPGQVIRYCQAYPTKSQESWGHFHESAFRFFGGVFPTAIYDNDSVLVKKIIGTERYQTVFSRSLEEHYNFTSVFCNTSSGNEKGAVENAVGFCRRNYLPGLPSYPSYDELNHHLEQKAKEYINNENHYKTGDELSLVLEKNTNNLIPLPPPKQWYRWENLSVNRYQVITYAHHWYSVPERYIGSTMKVGISVFAVQIYKDNELITQHTRQYTKGKDSLNLNHYLDQLSRKPRALLDCKPFKHHRFPKPFRELFNRMYQRMDRRTASKEFIKVLLLGRRHSEEELNIAIELAMESGCSSYDGIVLIISQLTTTPREPLNESWLAEHNPLLANQYRQRSMDLNQFADLHQLPGGCYA